jgi:hypothetical protein
LFGGWNKAKGGPAAAAATGSGSMLEELVGFGRNYSPCNNATHFEPSCLDLNGIL